MNEYRIGFTVENAYLVAIEATSADTAREKFEAMYAENFEQMPGCEFVEVDHTVHSVELVKDPFKNFVSNLRLIRGIGADNRIQIVARITEDGLPVYRVEEMSQSFEAIVCEDFDTLGEAINRANALLIEEEEVSGIEQERF
jgi:hypothetical protein